MRDDDFKMTGNLSGFETQLASLVPTGVDGMRDRVMFEAGRRSAANRIRAWRGVASLMAASLALALILPHLTSPVLSRQDTGDAPGIQVAQTSQGSELAAIRTTPLGSSGYLNVRSKVLEQGLQALPAGEYTRPTAARPGRFDWADAS